MKKNELIALGLLSASFFALPACAKNTAEPLDIFENMPQSEVVVEEVKPAEPVLVEVFPEKEVVYVEDETVDAYDEGDIDFYGKDEVKQPAPEVPNTGFPTIKEEPTVETSNSDSVVTPGVPVPTETISQEAISKWGSPVTDIPWIPSGDGGIFGD